MRSVFCVQSWHSLVVLHHHLPFDDGFCLPLAFRHKKEEYIEEFLFSGGEYFYWLELVEFRLYLGASHCILSFLACHTFAGIFMLGGVTFIALYEFFIDICIYFVLFEIKNLFCLLVFSTHVVMHFV